MKMTWAHVAAGVIAFAALVGLYRASPAMRATVETQSREWLGWTEEARRADPVGFTNYVERKLKADTATFQTSRVELAKGLDQLSGKLKEQEAYRDQARKLADEFRGAFQSARQGSSFPTTIRNAAYSEEQLVAQVSLLLAEVDGFDGTVRRLNQIRQQAATRMQEIVVRQNATEAQLAAISAQRGLLRASQLTTEGEALIAQVEELLEVNHTTLRNNPVRPLAELLSDSTPAAPGGASLEAARKFLDQPLVAEAAH